MGRAIHTSNAPQAIGPYSQAVRAGNLVFLSGQICLDPATGELHDDDVGQETRQVMANLEAVLQAAGLGFEDLVKTTIYLSDLGDFQSVNEIYGERFGDHPPARATVQVSALPRGVRVEIDGVAMANGN